MDDKIIEAINREAKKIVDELLKVKNETGLLFDDDKKGEKNMENEVNEIKNETTKSLENNLKDEEINKKENTEVNAEEDKEEKTCEVQDKTQETTEDDKDKKIKKLEKAMQNWQSLYHWIFSPALLFVTAYLKNKTDAEINKFCEETGADKDMLTQQMETINKNYQRLVDKINIENIESNEKTDDDYEVGYKKPPKETRFQKGNKGNKKGRKSIKDGDIFEMVANNLKTRIKTESKNGRVRKMYKKHLVAQKLANQLVKGERIPRNNIEFIRTLNMVEYFKKHRNDSV